MKGGLGWVEYCVLGFVMFEDGVMLVCLEIIFMVLLGFKLGKVKNMLWLCFSNYVYFFFFFVNLGFWFL